MKLITALMVGLCGVLATSVWAEDEKGQAKGPAGKGARPGARRPGGPGGEAMREQILKQFDKDGDGKLSDEEKTAAMKDRGGRPGGPGAGGPGAGGRPGGGPGGAGMAEIIKKFDKDGNGKLSEEERQAARAGMAKGGRPGGHPAAGGAPGQRRRPDGAGAKKPE